MSHRKSSNKSLFLDALEIESDAERAAFLQQACGDNPELQAEIEALLDAHANPPDVVKQIDEVQATIDQPTAEKPGTVIGHYKLLEELGEGGMGVVYMAEQTEPVKRRVALKIIKPGMDTRQVIARFEAERQALAMMDHPNIAKVLDAGTTDNGRPYFVMELVNGIPITAYCDQQHLNPQERLELFIPVCLAIQHAHQKGIIHRDLKPSNVLIALYDSKPVSKVIDFGVAKATSQNLTEKTLFTQLGQIVGTLEYMSPEQAQRNQLDIDTRSDIYSLGVLLYELLTGATPFDRQRLRTAAFDEMLRIIREEEPPKPSTKVSTSDSLASIAANRHVDPQRLTSLVRGELDWIVMKALEKDRTRRYDTANGLANDIQRYLNDEPVVACPPSTLYRFRKLARRNKAALATAAVVTAALLFGIVGTTWQAIRATDAWDDAVKAQIEEAAQRVLAEKARTAAEDARRQEQAQREEAERHRMRAEANFALARSAVDKFLNQVTENELLTVPGMQPLRQQLLSSAMEFYNEFAKDEVNSSELLMELATAHYRMAIIRHELGQTKTAAASVKKSIELFEQIRDAGDNSLDVQLGLARAYIESGRFKDALVSCRRILQTDANHAETRWMLSDAYHMLGGQLAARRTYSEVNVALVLKYFQNSLEIREKMVEEFPDTPKYLAGLGTTVNNLGVLLGGQGRPREALPMFERAAQCLAEAYRRNPRAMRRGHFLGLCLKNVAETQADLGNLRDALQSMQQLVEVRRKLVFENPAVTYLKGHLYKAHLDLGDLQMALGDATSANLSFRTAQDVMENFPRNTAGELFELATVYGALATPEYGASDQTAADRDDRQRYADLAMETIAAAVEKGWQDVGAIEHHTHLAPIRERDEFKQLVDRLRKELEAGRLATAGGGSDQQQLANRQQAADVLRELAGGDMPARQHRLTLATTLHSIGQIQIELEHYDQAERSLQEALQIRQELLKESLDNPELQLDTLITRTAIGQLWWNTDRVHQSHPLWQDVLVQLHELAASQPDDPAFQQRVATLEREICHRYAQLGLWDLAATVARHNAAMKRITNDEYDIDLAVILAAAGEEDAWRDYCQTVMDEIEANSTGSPPVTQIARTFCLLEPPALDVERCISLASEFLIGRPANQREWPEMCAALAYYRGSRFDEAWNLLKSNRITNCMDFDTGNVTHLPAGYLYALVAHANGRKEHAVAKLEQVEGLYRIACRNALATNQTKLCPGFLKFPWELAAAQILRREAWRKIHDQAAPADGWWHLVRARSYWRIGDQAKAQIELAATETMTAEDSELFLARAWLFGHFGMATRAEAELTKMVEVGGVDPMPWIHRGRWYAEQGELAKADADYAKAAARTPDELNKFLEAGWWVVGPYPPELDEFCPPEVDPDPSKPVHTIDPKSGLSGKPRAWQPIPADNTGRINRTYFPGRNDPTSQYYALAHVYSPDERCMLLRRERGGPSKKMKLWVNGVQVATVTNEWWQKRIPIVLRRGRNELLIKGPATACVLRLGDNLLDRAQTFHEQGRWLEAATELCTFSNTPTLVRSASKELLGRLLPSVACSKDQETYNALSMIVLRHPRPHLFTLFGAYTFPSPYSKLDADESIAIADESVLQMPRNFGAKRDAAVINYRIGRFDAARAYLDKIPTGDPELDPGLPLQALLCWHQEDQASARRWLSLAMNQFNALTGADGQMLSARLRGGFDWAWEVSTFCVLLCEAHRDITGSDADIHDRLQAFAKRQRDFWLNQDPDIALFDHAVFTENHDHQRVYLARAKRLVYLGRFAEAETDFNTAVALSPDKYLPLLERAELYLLLGKLDEAVDDYLSAHDLANRDSAGKESRLVEATIRRHVEVLDELQKRDVQQSIWWRLRGERAAALHDWQEAARCFSADAGHWSHAVSTAAICCLRDNVTGYETAYSQLPELLDEQVSSERDRHSWQAIVLGLRPQESAVAEELKQLAQAVAEGDLTEPHHEFALGLAHFRAQQYDEAVDWLQKSPWVPGLYCAHGPSKWAVLAMACFHLGRNEEAREWLEHCETWIDSSSRHVALAFQGNPSAGRYLGSPEWIMAHVLTREAVSLVDGPEALANLERNLSNRYAELRRNISETAKNNSRRISDQLNDDPSVWLRRARLFATEGNWTAAANTLSKAARLRPQDGRIWQECGKAHFELGQWGKAIDDYGQAIRLIPANPNLYLGRGEAALKLGRYDQAVNDGQYARQLAPDDFVVALVHAQILVCANRTDEYRQVCQEVLRRFGQTQNEDSFCHAARTCMLAPTAVDDPMVPVQLAARAVAHAPIAWRVYTLGMGLLRSEKLEESAQRFRESLKVDPGWDGRCLNHLGLALVHLRQQETKEARRWLDKADEVMGRTALALAQDRIEGVILRREVEQLLNQPGRESAVTEGERKQQHKNGKPMSNKKPVDNSPDVDLDSAKDNVRESVTKQ